MARYNGVDKDAIVDSIDQTLDLILRDKKISPLEQDLYNWIDGRKLAILRQSASDEELARNMEYTGANRIFAEKGKFLLSLNFNTLAADDRKTIENLKSWNAFDKGNAPKR